MIDPNKTHHLNLAIGEDKTTTTDHVTLTFILCVLLKKCWFCLDTKNSLVNVVNS